METVKFLRVKNRNSRFHDEKGNLIPWRNFILHFIPAFGSGLLRLLFNYRPVLPWIPYQAINELQKVLNKDKIVLEFGSGNSTIWFSKKAKAVYSVEDSEEWVDKLNKFIKKKNIKNIHCKFATDKDYYKYQTNSDLRFDLIIIDGSHRSLCLKEAINLVKSGGIVYIDDSDKDSTSSSGDMRVTESFALTISKEKNAKIEYYTDFVPTQFFVQQGMMLRLPIENP